VDSSAFFSGSALGSGWRSEFLHSSADSRKHDQRRAARQKENAAVYRVEKKQAYASQTTAAA
jgi:hypothetical protein